MKRLIPLLVLPVLVVALVFPASAAEYPLVDYNDYVYNTIFDGTNDHVYIRFPESLCNMQIWTYYPTTQFIDSVAGNSATWELLEAYRYYSNAYPMGYGIDAADSPKLDLSNIPDGTSIHFDITYNWSYYDGETGLFNTPTYDAWAIYYNAAGYVVSSQQFTAGTTPGQGQNPSDSWSFDLTINKPNDAVSVFVYAQLDSMVVYEEGELTFTLSNFTMDFSVAALYRLQQQTSKNNALLNSISNELAAQGDTIEQFVAEQQQTNDLLDDMINGSVPPSRPSWSDIEESLGDLEQDALGNVNNNIDKIDDAFDSALDALVSYSQSIYAAAFIFNLLADIPFIGALLFVSLSLGVVASIFGVAASVLNRSSKEATDSKKALDAQAAAYRAGLRKGRSK